MYGLGSLEGRVLDCIQQWMLVNANELPLLSVHWNVALSVLTRDQMSSF